jgi:hypothetical protein
MARVQAILMGVTGWWIELISNAASRIRSPLAAAVGQRNNPTGTAAPKLKPTVASLNGLMVPQGAAASTLQRVSFQAVAGLDGVIDTALRSPTAAATSAQGFSGTSAMSMQTATTALAGTQAQSGSIGASITKTTTAASGTHTATGIQHIASASTNSTSITMPTHQAGDLLLCYAWRGEVTTLITVPAGWTNIIGTTGSGHQIRMAWKIAASSSETSGTWTNATNGIEMMVYRNAAGPTDFNWMSHQTARSSTITYPLLSSLQATDGRSWIVRGAKHDNTTNLTANTPAGYVGRTNISNTARVIDSNSAVATAPVAATQSVNGSGNWLAVTLEIPHA